MKTRIILFLLLSGFFVQAQNYKYGRASKEELQKEKSLIDPEAPAEILYEKATVRLEFIINKGEFEITKEIEGRIKIYDKDKVDEDYLKHEVLYYTGAGSREKLAGFKGTTYNLENGKIQKTKVRGADIYSEEKNKYWSVDKFAFPNVQNGSVLEYTYTIYSPGRRDIGRWFFQKDIPVVFSQYTFIRPEFFIFSQDERGAAGKIRTDAFKDPDFTFRFDVSEYTYENVEAIKDEPFVLNPDNLKSSVRFELMKFEYPGVITENYSSTWEQIGINLIRHSDFGGQLSGNNFLNETVESLTEGMTDSLEKMKAIYDYVKDNYSWNRFRSVYTENGIRKTFKDKTGNCADINLMLVSMLQKAGINASPVVLSTVDNLMINYTYPSLTSLDFTIAGVVINDGLYLMDATEKYSDINMLPLRDLNLRGFMVMEKGIREVPLVNYSVSSIRKSVNATLTEDGNVSGNFSEVRSNYFTMEDKRIQTKDPQRFESNYQRQYNFDIENFRIDEVPDKKLIRYNFKFSNLKFGESLGGKLIINPMLFTQNTKTEFTGSQRVYPLEFGTILSSSTTVKLKIPAGYKVESIPENKKFLVEDGVVGYSYEIEEDNGVIILTTIYEVAESILAPSYYEPMKELENKQLNAEAEQIVLVKN